MEKKDELLSNHLFRRNSCTDINVDKLMTSSLVKSSYDIIQDTNFDSYVFDDVNENKKRVHSPEEVNHIKNIRLNKDLITSSNNLDIEDRIVSRIGDLMNEKINHLDLKLELWKKEIETHFESKFDYVLNKMNNFDEKIIDLGNSMAQLQEDFSNSQITISAELVGQKEIINNLNTDVMHLKNSTNTSIVDLNKKMNEVLIENINLKSQCQSFQSEIKNFKEISLEFGRCASKFDIQERASNFVISGIKPITGMPAPDFLRQIKFIIEKLLAIFGFVDLNFSYKYIGNNNKFILVTLIGDCVKNRDNIVKKSYMLKKPLFSDDSARLIHERYINELEGLGQDPALIFVKKDLHPKVRAEWYRLNQVINVEKEKSENIGITISMDPRKRVVYRGEHKPENIIDSWKSNFF